MSLPVPADPALNAKFFADGAELNRHMAFGLRQFLAHLYEAYFHGH